MIIDMLKRNSIIRLGWNVVLVQEELKTMMHDR